MTSQALAEEICRHRRRDGDLHKLCIDLRTGASDPDVVFPEMRPEMEAAGINGLVEDVNEELAFARKKARDSEVNR